MKLWPLKFLALVFFALWSISSQAFEVQPYLGSLSYSSLDGCCQSSSGQRIGVGALLRLPTEKIGTIDILGFTDRRWTEFSLLKPVYFHGEPEILDPTQDDDIRVRRISDWRFVFSYGGGFFTHSTRTKNYDLPAIVSGINLSTQSQLAYTVNDRIAVVGVFHLGLAWAADDKGTTSGLFLGINYRP